MTSTSKNVLIISVSLETRARKHQAGATTQETLIQLAYRLDRSAKLYSPTGPTLHGDLLPPSLEEEQLAGANEQSSHIASDISSSSTVKVSDTVDPDKEQTNNNGPTENQRTETYLKPGGSKEGISPPDSSHSTKSGGTSDLPDGSREKQKKKKTGGNDKTAISRPDSSHSAKLGGTSDLLDGSRKKQKQKKTGGNDETVISRLESYRSSTLERDGSREEQKKEITGGNEKTPISPPDPSSHSGKSGGTSDSPDGSRENQKKKKTRGNEGTAISSSDRYQSSTSERDGSRERQNKEKTRGQKETPISPPGPGHSGTSRSKNNSPGGSGEKKGGCGCCVIC